MSKTIIADGKTYIVPDDATDEEINEIVGPAPGSEKPIGEQPASVSGVAQTMGNQASRAIRAGLENINPMPLVSGAAHILDFSDHGQNNTLMKMFDASSDAIGRARAALKQGNYGEAAKSGLGALPIVGPGVEQITREATEGKIPEAVGHVGGLVAGPKIYKGVGKGLVSVAGPIAEKAIGITANDRRFDANPGKAILEETTSVRPARLAEQAQERAKSLTSDLDNIVNSNPKPVSLQPARDAIGARIAENRGQNASMTAEEMEPMRRFLTEPTPGFRGATAQPPAPLVPFQTKVLGPNGQPLVVMRPGTPPPPVVAPFQSAPDFLGMRRGFNKEFGEGSTWTAKAPSAAQGAARETYHALTDELHQTVPGTAGPDTRLQNLLPVIRAAEAVGRREGIVPGTVTRVAAKTGALAPAILGAQAAGLPGAALGATAPEMLTSPSPLLLTARGLNFGGKGLVKAAPVIRGTALVNPLSEGNTR